MQDIGNFSLVLAFLTSVYAMVVGAVGASRVQGKSGQGQSPTPTLSRSPLVASARNSLFLSCFFTFVSLVVLGVYFLNHDYHYAYVWKTSNNDMHPLYLISAIWGGMDGSMLLWASILSLFVVAALLRTKKISQGIENWLVPVMAFSTTFFLIVVTFLTNPFRTVPGLPEIADGNGLNPLLQNPSMLIHPPFLYTGFTGFMIPFAFCFAALLSGDLSDAWTRVTRRWTLIAWGFLTIGIILGGNWAYIELGWGGFWAWDPVENASFLPWLTGTAFLHSVMVQQQRGMLKVWNVFLSVLTYGLTIFGTFLTRSGIVQSVHAFAATDVGWVFLAYLALIIVLTIVLLAYRWSELKPESSFQSFFSRETAFLFNNLLLLSICFATFWGVMFPVISEAVTGEKSVVGPPFFNKVNVPLFLALIFLMGVGPLIAWKRSSLKSIKRLFITPFICGSLVTILFLVLDISRPFAGISFGLCTFVLFATMFEFHRAIKVRKEMGVASGIVKVVLNKPRRYGGHIVHLGVVVMTIAITASMAYKQEKDIVLKVGESYQIGRYDLKLDTLDEKTKSNHIALISKVSVSDRKTGEKITDLYPERRFYPKSNETTTEVDIRMTLLEDLYLALAGLESGAAPGEESTLDKMAATFKIYINPLQIWLWFGSMVVLFGTLIVLFVPESSIKLAGPG